MAPTFNLLDEPWIPCLIGGKHQELGIRDTFRNASAITEIRASSPLVTVAVHRFLLAILHRVFGPKGRTEWKRLWDRGELGIEDLETYLGTWRDRFDLFHCQRPFFQDAAFQAKTAGCINQMFRELARGNNATLFDHTFENPPPALAPALVARALIAEQTWAVGGGKSDLGYTSGAPLVGGVAVLVQGESLFETLLLNLVRYPDSAVMIREESDAPAWEKGGRPVEGSPTPDGLLDYLTWQSRSILLHPEEDGRVRHISYAQGRIYDPDGLIYEPMSAYQRDPAKKQPDRPVRLQESRDLWRDSSSLFHFAEADTFRGPANLRWLKTLYEEEVIPRTKVYRLSVFGLCTDKAKVNFWRQEQLPLPLDYLADENLVHRLKAALDLAESVARDLRGATAATAAKILAPGDMPPDKKRVWALVDSLAPDRLYWSRLEVPFRFFLESLPGTAEHQKRKVDEWFLGTLKPIAVAAFRETAGQLDHSARALRAAVVGERQLFAVLTKNATQVGRPVPAGVDA